MSLIDNTCLNSSSSLNGQPFEQLQERYQHYLADRGNALSTIKTYLGVLDHFARWFEAQGLASVAVKAKHADTFLNAHLPQCGCPAPNNRDRKTVRAALHQFLRMLNQATKSTIWPPAIAEAIASYDTYLDALAGLARATRLYRQRYAGEFLLYHFATGPLCYQRLLPADIRTYAVERSRGLTSASAAVMCVSLRSFLRFLQVSGHCKVNLADAVPSAAVWRTSKIPGVLDNKMVQRLLESFDRVTVTGKRDYAMGRCLIDLGLRTSEVAHLRLEDLDWHRGILFLRAGKSRRANQLPLPLTTGEAITDYLRGGRPVTASRALFVHHRSLSGTPLTPEAVRAAMRRGFARAGIAPEVSQVHRLRHSAATRLLEAGVSFKTIADILNHRSYDTTARYFKVDNRRLLDVAMPWPGRVL